MIPIITNNGEGFWLNFSHRELDGSHVRQVPSYDELVDALVCAGYGFRSNQFKETGVSAVRSVLDRLEYAEKPSHCTVCKITRKVSADARDEIVSGMAYTSKDDNFCRETGRWYSLTRALEDLVELPSAGRPLTGDVLEAYFMRRRGQVLHDGVKSHYVEYSWQKARGKLELEAYTKWYLETYAPKHSAAGRFDECFRSSLEPAA